MIENQTWERESQIQRWIGEFMMEENRKLAMVENQAFEDFELKELVVERSRK